MAYSSLIQLRALSHYGISKISDAEVTALIPEADRGIRSLATIQVHDEILDGGIDSVNKIFTTEHTLIADVNFDKVVDDEDVTVYLMDYDSEQNPVSSEAEVDAVNARDGIITLKVAPTTTNAEEGLRADYRYYISPVDWDMLTLAANYYLAYLCQMKIQGEMPSDFSISNPQSNRLVIDPKISFKSHWLSLAIAQLPFAKPGLEIR